jgi:hypothetical protein
MASLTSPTGDRTVRATMNDIRRKLGTAPNQKAALLTTDLRTLLGAADPATAAGARYRALLLIGFAGGLRRSAPGRPRRARHRGDA